VKIGVLGTGLVGTTLASKLASLGHEVRMGARSPTNEKAAAWARSAGSGASAGTFADAAAFGELLFNCTNGAGTMAALDAAGDANLRGKVLVDVANPLDFSRGMPPILLISNTDSLGEQVQRTHPDARVVKALNTMNCNVMVDPAQVPGEHDVFLCGNDASAKAEVTTLLRSFGWQNVVDVGDISAARGQEMLVILWARLFGVLPSGTFNFHVAR
jgi:8-hydroxy-5-deazaflavin:NADPH oxidoreductase